MKKHLATRLSPTPPPRNLLQQNVSHNVMSRDGKQLEDLVEIVENELLPAGFVVSSRVKNYEDGVQTAEFDIVVKGTLGTHDVRILIECRDRPADGPAPGQWIEQLVTRRDRFKFDKVVAVSTSGFAANAVKFAIERGIETRTVKALSAEAFSEWLQLAHLYRRLHAVALLETKLIFHEAETEDRRAAISRLISSIPGDASFLRSVKTGQIFSAHSALQASLAEQDGLLRDRADSPVRIRLHVEYANPDDHYVVDTVAGPVRVTEIIFRFELSTRNECLPVTFAGEYVADRDGAVLSQIATFEPIASQEEDFAVEMHHLAEKGETLVCLRKLRADAKRWSSRSQVRGANVTRRAK